MNISSTVKLLTGRRMPIIGLGSWRLTDDTPETVVSAFQNGYRMIDTSADYGTQPGVGQGIKQSGIKREDFYLTTKVEQNDDAYQATKQDLAELRLDYADLMLIHRPPRTGLGEDLWRGLIRARDDGLTKDIGVSNYKIGQLEELIKITRETPVVNQIEWSPFGHSLDMLAFCNDHGIIIQAYSPLTQANRLENGLLHDLAYKYDKTPAQIIIRWNLQLGVVPLPKANQSEHQREDIDVFDFELNAADMQRLGKLNQHYSALSSKLLYAG